MARPRRYETAAEKQKAYRLRKKGLPFVKEESKVESTVPRTEMKQKEIHANDVVVAVNRPTISELRELVERESQKPPQEVEVARPLVYRNDYGGVISKFAWEKLQKAKAKAKDGGYEIDEYSQ